MVGKRKTSPAKGNTKDGSGRSAKKGKVDNPFLSSPRSGCSSFRIHQDSASSNAPACHLYSGLYSTIPEHERNQHSKTTVLDILLRFASIPTLQDAFCLTENLQATEADMQSKQMIAKILFPWVLDKAIMSGTFDAQIFSETGAVVEKTMLLCLDTLNEDQTRSILSTQVITKLLVSILDCSMATDDLRNLFVRVLTYYRPTMDVACKTVLSSLKSDSPLLQPTMHWLLSLHQSGKGNPKTTFQLVPDLNLLMLLDDSAVSKEFLADVLFHPQHHIDGFLALLQAGSDSTFKTYHTSLFQSIDEGLSDETKKAKINAMLPLLLECFFEQSKVFFDTKQRRKGLPLAAIQFRMFCKWSRHLLPDVKANLLCLSRMLRAVEENNACLPNKECTSHLSNFVLPLVEVARDKCMWSLTSDCFCSLLKLNHAVFGDRMNSVVRTSVQSDKFMATFVDTFKRLRQQNLIYVVLVALAAEQLVVDRLRDKTFSDSLIASFQSATLLEVRETFSALEGWHRDKFDGASGTEREAVSIIATIVIPSVHVDHGNAKDIARSCQQLVDQAKGFGLSALCMNLHLKCLFWLGKHSQLKIPLEILSKLNTGGANTEKEAVATVWCHQLHESTILLQEKEIHFLQVSGSERECTIQELRKQSETIAHRVTATRCWKVILENFHSWIPYADKDDIELLCRWMWNIVGQGTDIKNAHSVIFGLLETSYFYENDVIADNLRIFAFTEVVETILKVANEPEKLGRTLPLTSNHRETLEAISTSTDLRPKPAVALSSSKDLGLLEDCAKRCIRILDMVLQLPKTTKSPSIKSKHFDALLHIDQACRSIIQSVSDATAFFAVVAKCRLLLSMELNDCSSGDVSLHFSFGGLDILYPTLLSSIGVIKSHPEEPYETFEEVTKATGKFFYSISSLDETPTTNQCLAQATKLFVSLKPQMRRFSLSLQRALLGLARYFASAAISLFGREKEKLETADKQQLRESLNDLVVKYKALHPNMGDCVACEAINSLLEDWAAAEQWSARGPALCSGIMNKLQSAVTPETLLPMFPLISRPGSNKTERLGAIMKASNKISEQKCDQLHASVDALFCYLIKHTSANDFEATTKVLQEDTFERSVVLRYLGFCLTQVTEEVQVDVLHGMGRDLFSKGMQGMGVLYLQSNDFSTVKAALILIKELLVRRGVFVFRESDLAALLSRLSDIVNETKGAKGDRAVVQGYASLVFLTALQRYTKVIYACAPLVVYTLRDFLISLFDGPLLAQEDRGRSFIQICSLLSSSKDVYKKYVVGVVLEFARRLDGKRLGFILPAIYALLDMMSTHETEQLNALMDVQTRSLFKPIYDGYKKHHVFKG